MRQIKYIVITWINADYVQRQRSFRMDYVQDCRDYLRTMQHIAALHCEWERREIVKDVVV